MKQLLAFLVGLTVLILLKSGRAESFSAPDQLKTSFVQFTPSPGSPFKVGPMAQKVIVADLNADGQLDIVLTCGGVSQQKPDPKQGYVAVLFGNKQGGMALAQPLIALGQDGLKAAVGDLNGDKRPDIAVISHDSYTVTILFQNEQGRFDAGRKATLTASQGHHPHTHDVALADVNGDGQLDILTTNADEGTISVLQNDGQGRFTPATGSPFPAGQHPYEGLSIGDINGDGNLDVAIPNLLGKAVSVLLGNGAGHFTTAPGSPFSVGDRPGFVTLGDLTGDNRLDIVATHDDDSVIHILGGDGRGGFRPLAHSPVVLKETVWGAVIADMDADGKRDLVLGGKQGHVLFLHGEGTGRFAPSPVEIAVGGKGPGMLAVADMNGDGKLDIITSNYESGNVSVLLQR